MSQYFRDIGTSVKTLLSGLRITFGYLKQSHKYRKPYGIAEDEYFSQNEGLFTLQYPHEMMPVPDNGRYRLHNEIDDCIVCDKCAKICPVDCIDIDPIRAVDTIGLTSDGTPKRIHAAKFDIDMSKCCFCGLCTTVCPTECLTMTKTFDFSETDVRDHIYSFAEMSLAEIAQKRKELEEFQRAKELKASEAGDTATEDVKAKPAKPKFIPKTKTTPKTQTSDESGENEKPKPQKPKAVFKPRVQPKPATEKIDEESKPKSQSKPVIKPKFKPKPMIRKKPKDDK